MPGKKKSSKELVVSTTNANTGSGYGPQAIVFNQLTNEQLDKALAVFRPQPPTKPSLFRDAAFMQKLAEVVAFFESNQFTRKDGKIFPTQQIANHVDNVITDMINDEETIFHINEWFVDTRGPLPKELQKWDPNGVDPMPSYHAIKKKVDWFGILIQKELELPGFLDAIKNAIELEATFNDALQKYRTVAATTWTPDFPGTEMPPHAPTSMGNVMEYSASSLVGTKSSSSGGMYGRGINPVAQPRPTGGVAAFGPLSGGSLW